MTRATVDWKHVETLFNVSNSAALWPNLRALHDEAQDHLKDIHKDVLEVRQRSALDEKHKVDTEYAKKMEETEIPPGKGPRTVAPKPLLNPNPPSIHRGLFDQDEKGPGND